MAGNDMASADNPFPEPIDPAVAAFVSTLNEDQLEFFQERAGIAEFMGGADREQAERLAMALTQTRFGLSE